MALLQPVVDLERPSTRRRPDLVLFGALLALSAFGLLMIYAASRSQLAARGLDPSAVASRQAVFVAVGLVLFWVVSLVDPREVQRFVPLVFVVTVLALIAVLSPLGSLRQGAQRWIQLGPFAFQPSEFAKLGVIVVLAAVLEPAGEEGMTWRRIAQALGVVAVPAALIFRQPDLGTMLVFGFLALVMLFAAGTTWRQFFVLLMAGVLGVLLVWNSGLLQDYQRQRIESLINPEADVLGAAYNQRQSEIAIGSGQLTGKGLFQGSQTEGAFVPEQTTDFIFTVVGEQLGFLGAALVLFLYLVIVWRLLVIAATASDRFGALAVVGICALLVFHVFVNVGMTVRIMPVTGLPLPFLSAGGSAYLTMAAALGFAHAVRLHR